MKPMTRLALAGLVATSLGLCTTPARAQRGGGGRPSSGLRGGGSYTPRPSFNRTPSFNPGAAQRSRPSAPGGFQGQMRPSMPVQRPNYPNVGQPGVPRPGPSGPAGGGMRPPVANPGGPANPGVRPPAAGPGVRPPIAGPGGRPPGGPGYPGNRPPGNPGYPGNRPGGPGYPPPGGRPPGWGGGPPPAWAGRPGWNNHQAWVNGYWHGRNSNNNFWNNGGAFWGGLALGGVAGWGLNSAIYNWGYRPYVNPYAMVATQPVVIQQPVAVQPGVVQQPQAIESAPAYDYSQPLQASTPAAESVDPAMQTFDDARAAFKANDYASALQKTDEALKAMPNDAAVHEFRALCLFALKQYDQAAGVLYAVLSAGPGWDWTTLIGLYPDVDVYTAQLRALEAYRSANPNSTAARFVLAYHYLTAGFEDAAVREFNKVVELQPNDALSKQIVASLTGAANQPADASQPQPADAPATPAADEPSLVGTWKAAPDATTAIDLTLQADGNFTWNVAQQGKAQPIAGTYTYGGGVLTLVRAGTENDAMVGRVTWKDASHFVFQALGGGANDPGLDFTK
ncbi:MAG: hypothetical protein BGO49_12250 [Planctomycetales bacterium 71-10]|nr:MAG: hypothetical protein BGO49_12250 [Planctomycetales bacterium 71-10]